MVETARYPADILTKAAIDAMFRASYLQNPVAAETLLALENLLTLDKLEDSLALEELLSLAKLLTLQNWLALEKPVARETRQAMENLPVLEIPPQAGLLPSLRPALFATDEHASQLGAFATRPLCLRSRPSPDQHRNHPDVVQ